MSEKIKVLLSEEEVDSRIKQIAAKVSKDYAGKEIHLICVISNLYGAQTLKWHWEHMQRHRTSMGTWTCRNTSDTAQEWSEKPCPH